MSRKRKNQEKEEEQATQTYAWIALFAGIFLFFFIESIFDVNGIGNHILILLLCCCGLPIGTIIYLSFRVSDSDKKMRVNPFAEAEKNPNATPFAMILDTETTGLVKYDGIPTKKAVEENPKLFPNIVEIAWITVSRKYEEVSRKTFIIKQDEKIPLKTIKIHGITDERCEKKEQNGKKYMNHCNDLIECEYIVGRNIKFDKVIEVLV